jgi:hypothetical protein
VPRIEFRLPKDYHITDWILNLEGDGNYRADPTVTFTEVLANRYDFEKQGGLYAPETWFSRLNKRIARDIMPIYCHYLILVKGFQKHPYAL